MHGNDNNQACIFTEHNSERYCRHKSCHIIKHSLKQHIALSDNHRDSHMILHSLRHSDHRRIIHQTHCTYIFENIFYPRCKRDLYLRFCTLNSNTSLDGEINVLYKISIYQNISSWLISRSVTNLTCFKIPKHHI